MENLKAFLQEKIADADMVLVGLGEEMSAHEGKAEDAPQYANFIKGLKKEEEWLLPFIQLLYLREYPDSRLLEACHALAAMLEGKNYFIVSLGTDDVIYGTELKKDRLAAPCGGYRYMQCPSACGNRVTAVDERLLEELSDCIRSGKISRKPVRPVCESCGSGLIFNRIGVKKYVEAGYMEEWERYRLWLQGTVNRKLCVLELGVGMEYPSVIRWPFEKMVFLNQKASFFRIHSRLCQLAKEIGDRGYSIKAEPKNFLISQDFL